MIRLFFERGRRIVPFFYFGNTLYDTYKLTGAPSLSYSLNLTDLNDILRIPTLPTYYHPRW